MIAIYAILFVIMAAANIIGWMVVCCCDNICCVITFLILNVFALIVSICILALYHDYGGQDHDFQRDRKAGHHADANLGVGVITLVMNISLVIMSAIPLLPLVVLEMSAIPLLLLVVLEEESKCNQSLS